MLHEYAVEPQAIGESWERFRYVIEKFGFDRGRLISQFPGSWFKDVYQAADGLTDMQKKRVEEALKQAKITKVVRSHRPYDPQAGNWLHNAIADHGRAPFRAIIAGENPAGHEAVLLADDIDEMLPLMAVEQSCPVVRDAPSIKAALDGLLKYSKQLLFVDPFYDPFRQQYKTTFRECLAMVQALNPAAACEIHYRYHPNKPTNADLEQAAANLFPGVIPNGMKVTLYCWQLKPGGADFHARYLLTERGGIAVDAGFSADGAPETTDMHLMGYALSQQRMNSFERAATDYQLIGPVIRVAADGTSERL